MLTEMVTKAGVERDQARKQAEALQLQLDQRGEELAYIKSQLMEGNTERVELLAARADLQFQLEECRRQVEGGQPEGKLGRQEAELEALQKELQACKQQSLGGAQAQLEQRDAELAALRTQLQARDGSPDGLQARLEQKEQELQTLRADLEMQTHTIITKQEQEHFLKEELRRVLSLAEGQKSDIQARPFLPLNPRVPCHPSACVVLSTHALAMGQGGYLSCSVQDH